MPSSAATRRVRSASPGRQRRRDGRHGERALAQGPGGHGRHQGRVRAAAEGHDGARPCRARRRAGAPSWLGAGGEPPRRPSRQIVPGGPHARRPRAGARGLLIGERGSTWFSVQPPERFIRICGGSVTTRAAARGRVRRFSASRRSTSAWAAAALGRDPVTAARKSSRSSASSRVSVAAVTVAVRGTSRSRAISPNVVARPAFRQQSAVRRDGDGPLGDHVEPIPGVALAHDLRPARAPRPGSDCQLRRSRTGGGSSWNIGIERSNASCGARHDRARRRRGAAGATRATPASGSRTPGHDERTPRMEHVHQEGRQRRAHREARHQHGLLQAEHPCEDLVLRRCAAAGCDRPRRSTPRPRRDATSRSDATGGVRASATSVKGRPVTNDSHHEGGRPAPAAHQERGGAAPINAADAQRRRQDAGTRRRHLQDVRAPAPR